VNSNHGGQVFAAARRANLPVTRILDFSANVNPLGPSPKALVRLRRDLDLIRFYPDTENTELRDVVARQEDINEACILFGNGATSLLHLLPRVLKPRRALILEPGFGEYALALERVGCRIRRVYLRSAASFRLDRRTLFKTIRSERPNLMVLGNPNNPTGTSVPPALLRELIDTCTKNHIHLVVDESFIDFTAHRSYAEEASNRPYLIVVRSLTKFWALAGLRIGYLVARKALLEKLRAQSETWSVNTLASAAAADSLRDSKYRTATLTLVRRERKFLTKQLAGLGWLKPFPSETNFVLVRIEKPAITSTRLQEKLQSRNILIRDAAGFPGLDCRYFRIAVRNRRENQLLIDELRLIHRSAAHPERRSR
jgi:threonine-phosphate decarboxylase